jgi:2-polyprenyl-3-methyl-5-hydroxy-6-metoxy-1,4-benzoquinol methylase
MIQSDTNQQSYDKIAHDFDIRRRTSPISKEVTDFTKVLNIGSHVLDVGCGGGVPNALFLTQAGFVVTGIDISAEMIQVAQSAVPKAKFIQSGILEFHSNEKFEAILAWDSLFHLSLTQHEIAFSKIYDLLHADGYFLFTHGGSEGRIQSEMYGETFEYSSPGSHEIRNILTSLKLRIISWQEDYTDKEGYIKVLCQK